MFGIDYKIITAPRQEIEYITEEEIQYKFLLGNVFLFSSNGEIKMEWGWIPLLDFAYCLKMIVKNLKANNTAKEYFEFTENNEKLEFSREGEQLKIRTTFPMPILETTLTEFEKALYEFHINISGNVRRTVKGELPSILQKYLSI